SSRRRHTSFSRDWSSDVCSSDLKQTSNLLFNRNLQQSSGFSSTLSNLGKLKNTGVEFNFHSAVSAGAFNWNLDVNASRNWSEVRSEERRVGELCRSGWWQEE